MEITLNKTSDSAVLSVSGRLDTNTAPELEKQIQSLTEINSLSIDLKDLEYISSAGLRVLLSAHKAFEKKDGLVIQNVQESVLEVFDVTGFKDILNIK